MRRLLPAACVTLAICALGVFIFLPETRWADIGMQIIASAFYFENFYLYFASLDYLAADYDPSPFQHYWSLSIEEQFYVVWPLLLLAGLAYARRAGVEPRAVYMALCAGILAVSLTISIIVTPENPGAYFLTQARIWELSLGGLVATLHPYVNPGKKSSALLRWCGLAAIGWSAWYYTQATVFPGYAALLPTLGCAVILITPHSDAKRDPGVFLSWPLMRYLGDISYSLYLWHWPIIVFAAASRDTGFSLIEGIGLATIAVGLSHLTKVHVEDRFRHKPEGTGYPRSFSLGAGFLATASVLAIALALPGFLAQRESARISLDFGNYPGALVLSGESKDVPDMPFVPPLSSALRDNPAVYADGCHVARDAVEPTPCYYGSRDARKTIVIAGDSHAAQWIPALRAIAETRDYLIVTHTKSACPFIEGAVTRGRKLYSECAVWNENAMRDIIELQPDLLVTAKISSTTLEGYADPAANDAGVASGLAAAWQRLGDAGIPVIALEQTPRFVFSIPECVAKNPANPQKCARPRSEVLGRYDPTPIAAARVATARAVTMNDLICLKETCPPIIGNVLIYRDPHHLTATYSRTLAHALSLHIEQMLRNQ